MTEFQQEIARYEISSRGSVDEAATRLQSLVDDTSRGRVVIDAISLTPRPTANTYGGGYHLLVVYRIYSE